MTIIDWQTPSGQQHWRRQVARRAAADPLARRSDPLTLRAFGRPVNVPEAVATVLAEVRQRGDAAVLKYARRLEGLRVSRAGDLRVSPAERREAWKLVAPALRRALRETAGHIRDFHRQQLRTAESRIRRPGLRAAERRLSLERVGVYVPGGRAPLVSTVLMNALPARLAGVRTVVLATPPGPDGRVPPALLAAADLAGADEVLRLGGAAAIALLAFGTATYAPVEKIVGPGNAYVTEAKRQVVGWVGIDSLAGPSEILILADDSAMPEEVAWDLLAQGEHGSGAVAVLLTPSISVARAVASAIQAIVRQRPELATASQAAAIYRVPTLTQALALANDYAPEHLSLQVRRARRHVAVLRRAGAVFLGPASAQSMGDYTAGPNHVLPTGGTASWASPLSARDFWRYQSVIEYSRAGLRREGPAAAIVADAEGLRAHAESIRCRLSPRLARGRRA